MGIQYKLVNIEFDKERWANAVDTIVSIVGGRKEAAELLNVNITTIGHWQTASLNADAPYPSMTNFLIVVNMLDLWPQQTGSFFKLEDATKKE